jgi:hypothetical protein
MLDIPPGRWTGLDGLGDSALQEIRPQAERAVFRAGLFFQSQLRITVSGARHGRVYMIGKNFDITHIASAPGEPPAVMFGRFRNSIDFVGPTWEGWTVTMDVGSNAVQARRLEWGGFHTQRETVSIRGATGWFTVKAGTVIRTLPRPWMEPTVIRVRADIERILEQQ